MRLEATDLVTAVAQRLVNNTTTSIELGLQVRGACKLLLRDWAEGVSRVVSMLIFRKAIHAKIEIWAVIARYEVFTREFLQKSAREFA